MLIHDTEDEKSITPRKKSPAKGHPRREENKFPEYERALADIRFLFPSWVFFGGGLFLFNFSSSGRWLIILFLVVDGQGHEKWKENNQPPEDG